MKKTYCCLLGWLLVGWVTSTAFGEDVFAPVKVVYMKNGDTVQCQMGWLDGTKMVCRKFGGSISMPLQSVNLEKTFPKFKQAEGETILLIHPGESYRDEDIVVSNLRIVREHDQRPAPSPPGPRSNSDPPLSHQAIMCDLLNRGEPCAVNLIVTLRDANGTVRHQIDMVSESRIDTEDRAILKKRLDMLGINLEDQISSLRIKGVERKNILQHREEIGSDPRMNTAKLREDNIRALKEHFLKERPQSELQ